jgi:hypothetical protein
MDFSTQRILSGIFLTRVFPRLLRFNQWRRHAWCPNAMGIRAAPESCLGVLGKGLTRVVGFVVRMQQIVT